MHKKYIMFLLFLGLFLSCSKTPKIDLQRTNFHLQIPPSATEEFFGRVKSIAIDDTGNFYILDSEQVHVVKFDRNGVFVKELISYGWGNGFVNRPSSIQVLDTTLILHNLSSLQFFSLDGTFRKSVEIGGRAAISVARDGTILANRMSDRFQFGYCLETFDAHGKPLATFRSPRSQWFKNNAVDFAFAEFARDGKIVYIPTLLDSAFLYDPSGRLLLAKKMEPVRPAKTTGVVFHVEDMFVAQNAIYLLRVNPDTSAEEVSCKRIDQYDFQFNHLASFELPAPVTIGIELEPWAPWYRKFIVRRNRFYLMVSQPIEHLVVYEPLSEKASALK